MPPFETMEDWLYDKTGGIVQSGPFKGMKMLPKLAWADGRLCPMLLGCHEQELWVPITQEIERLEAMAAPTIVNMGCGEGYYAVGLAQRLPHADVVAADTLPAALETTAKAAALNGASLRTSQAHAALLVGADLVVMDCEGAEMEYLMPVPSGMKSSTIIVELHRPKAAALIDPWAKTHEVYILWEGGRNPCDYEMLRDLPSMARWCAVDENRPCQMAWLLMRPKQ